MVVSPFPVPVGGSPGCYAGGRCCNAVAKLRFCVVSLGSGLTDHSQKMTVAASAMAEKKAVGHRS